MFSDAFKPTSEDKELLKRSGSADYTIAMAAQAELAKAVEQPLREGIMPGGILDNIFEPVTLEPGASTEFQLSDIAPGTEKDFIAYTIPNHGRIASRQVEGDYVTVPTYMIGNSIDWLLKYAREARWDMVGHKLQVLKAGMDYKMSLDGWHAILTALVDRNIVVFDSDAGAGQFTKRLVSLMSVLERRNGGGNSTSINRKKLTDLYISPEASEDIRNWGVDQVDEFTRRDIFLAEGSIVRLFGVNLHAIDELGEGQEFQDFFSTDLSGSLAASDVELVVGLDLSRSNSFVMPVKMLPEVYPDPALHREMKAGLYSWAEIGLAVLDGRNVIGGSF